MYLGDIFGDTKVTANGYCLRLPVTLPNRLYSNKSTVILHCSTNSYNAELWKIVFLAIKFPNYTYTYIPINFSHRLISNT